MGRKQILVTGFRSQTAGCKREHHNEEGGDTGVWSMFALGGEGADDGMQAKVWRIWSKNVCGGGGGCSRRGGEGGSGMGIIALPLAHLSRDPAIPLRSLWKSIYAAVLT